MNAVTERVLTDTASAVGDAMSSSHPGVKQPAPVAPGPGVRSGERETATLSQQEYTTLVDRLSHLVTGLSPTA